MVCLRNRSPLKKRSVIISTPAVRRPALHGYPLALRCRTTRSIIGTWFGPLLWPLLTSAPSASLRHSHALPSQQKLQLASRGLSPPSFQAPFQIWNVYLIGDTDVPILGTHNGFTKMLPKCHRSKPTQGGTFAKPTMGDIIWAINGVERPYLDSKVEKSQLFSYFCIKFDYAVRRYKKRHRFSEDFRQ